MAQKELVTCLGKMYKGLEVDLYGHKTFANTGKGFEELLKWVKNLTEYRMDFRYVMEAIVVYLECLAYFLFLKK